MKINSVIAIAIVGFMIVSGLTSLVSFHQASQSTMPSASPSSPIIAHTATINPITVSIVKPASEQPTWLFTKVAYFSATPLYFRLIGMTHTGAYNNVSSVSNSTVTQVISGHSWFVNTTDGKYKLVYTFVGSIDATNSPVLQVYGNVTTCTDDAKYNTTTLYLYTGANSLADTGWFAKIVSNVYWDYYGIKAASAGYKSIRYVGDKWLVSTCNSNVLYSSSVPGRFFASFDNYDTGWGLSSKIFSNTSTKCLDNFLRLAMKFTSVNQNITTAPKLLVLCASGVWANWLSFDSETMIQTAAQVYHYTHVAIWDNYMTPGTYQWLNASIGTIMDHVKTYTHKYGMQFGIYFGWRDFTSNGANHPIYTRTTSNTTNMLNAYGNFSSIWGSYGDFFYFDYAFTRPANPTDQYAGWYDYYLLDPIFKAIKASSSKLIIYNSQGSCWWVNNGGFVPINYEGMQVSARSYWLAEVWDDPYIHNLKYPQIMWTSPFLDAGGSNPHPANTQTASDLCLFWGITPVGAYNFGNIVGMTAWTQHFNTWIAWANRTGNVTGSVGYSAVLETADRLSVVVENNLTIPIITPSILNVTQASFSISYSAMNGTRANLQLVGTNSVFLSATSTFSTSTESITMYNNTVYQAVPFQVTVSAGSMVMNCTLCSPSSTGVVARWTSTANNGTVVAFALAGLNPDLGYRIYVDNQESFRQDRGYISLNVTYSGSWSTHQFEVQAFPNPFQALYDMGPAMLLIGFIAGISAIAIVAIGSRLKRG